ncbi:MAG: hypothetical protein FK734_00415 [Asgard group archaeon]|nr:hypothetical protein [Asgard group archaeon]
MSEQADYFSKYMEKAAGTPEPIVRGVLLFFKSTFTNEQLEYFEKSISNLDVYSLANTQKFLKANDVGDEISRQIIQLLNKKFKEAIEKKAITEKKLDFIRSVKKKH